MNAESLSVVVADDHPVFRKGLIEVLSEAGGLRVVGEAADGEAALWQIETHAPGLAILDLEMPKLSGLEVTEQIKQRGLSTIVIVLTMHRVRAMLERALQCGVRGYLLKDHAATDIATCIHLVMAGGTYISPGITGGGVDAKPLLGGHVAAGRGIARLTATELQVLKLIAAGQTTPAIAGALGIRPKTVEHHRSNICGKLDLTGTNALVRFAAEHRALLD